MFSVSRTRKVVSVLLAVGPTAAALAQFGPLTIAEQGSFFVGGRDIQSESLSLLSAYEPAGTVTVDQVYVRYQIPVGETGSPVTLIHGCCLTGKTWESTPDGRMGWDEYFVRAGHAVYVVDQAFRGRSAADPSAINRVKRGDAPIDELPTIISAGHEAAWTIFRFGPSYPKANPGLKFPLEAAAEFWKQMVPDWRWPPPATSPTVPALAELARRLDGTVLMSHSQSGIYPFLAAQLDPTGIDGIVAIEPSVCPDASADLEPYKAIPILLVWGDYIELSPRWAPRLARCAAFAAALLEAGGQIESLVLPDIGIDGNSHMLMQDTNNLEIADLLLTWIDTSAL